MRVAAVQYDIAWEDKPTNHDRVAAVLDEATLCPGTLAVLPEMGDTGFSFDLDLIVDDSTLPWATALAQRLGVYLQVGHVVRGPDGRGLNCASLVTPSGSVAGTYEKVFPFSYGKEIEHFSGGDHLVVAQVAGATVSPLICYDLRFPELWRHAARAGANVLTIGANWPSVRQLHWRSLLIARAIENQAFVVAANRIGSDPNLAYRGGSMIIAPTGEILAEAQDDEAVIQAEIDPATAEEWRRVFPALTDMRDDLLGAIRIES